MNKIFQILTIILLLLACSNDTVNKDETYFSPPNWIQGEWIWENEGGLPNPNIVALEFAKTDFILVYKDYKESQNSFINSVNSTGVYSSEEISTNIYKISILCTWNRSL